MIAKVSAWLGNCTASSELPSSKGQDWSCVSLRLGLGAPLAGQWRTDTLESHNRSLPCLVSLKEAYTLRGRRDCQPGLSGLTQVCGQAAINREDLRETDLKWKQGQPQVTLVILAFRQCFCTAANGVTASVT